VNAKFNASAVNALPTALPDYDEQVKIANTLTTIDLKIKNQASKLNLLHTLFNSMLHHLMTGQIRVKDIDISGIV
jgi:type I restriction enzyme S subunit